MENIKFPFSKILAILLWLTTLVVGLLDIYVVPFITISIYARFFLYNVSNATPIDLATSNTVRITTIFIAAVVYVIFLIATSEYHFKHLDQPHSWRLLGTTIAVELLIIIIAQIMGPITW